MHFFYWCANFDWKCKDAKKSRLQNMKNMKQIYNVIHHARQNQPTTKSKQANSVRTCFLSIVVDAVF